MGMHTFDIIFGALVLLFVFFGIRRGFIEEVMRLAAVVIGFLGALAFYRHLTPKLSFLSLPAHLATIGSFLIIFFCIAIVIVLIGKFLKSMVKLTMMGWLDRLCGACLGGLKAFFVGWIFVTIVSSIPIPAFHQFFKDSRTYAFFVAISPALKSQVLTRTASSKKAFSAIDSLKEFWKKTTAVELKPDSSDGKEPRRRHAAPAKEKKR
jgi:membrane protein required for colicin V production